MSELERYRWYPMASFPAKGQTGSFWRNNVVVFMRRGEDDPEKWWVTESYEANIESLSGAYFMLLENLPPKSQRKEHK